MDFQQQCQCAEAEFSRSIRWKTLTTRKRERIKAIVVDAVQGEPTLESAETVVREGIDPLTLWFLGQLLSFVIKALWEKWRS